MEITVRYTELIKPSRPTPPHLRRVPLSFIDQLNSRVFSPFIYFYAHPTNHSLLKKSLSQTLTLYYPLAGRLKEESVNCNDDGVPYFVARVSNNTSLREIVQHPDYAGVSKLLPFSDTEDPGEILLAVQVNEFSCSGIAVALCFNHKFMDGSSMTKFVTSWAAVTHSEHEKLVKPRFDLWTFFPALAGYKMPDMGKKGNVEKRVGKWFVFSSESVSLLRRRYDAALPHLKRGVSRVEALSVFVLTRFLVSNHGRKAKDVGRSYKVVQTVNIRARADPPLREEYFGNASRFMMTVPTMKGNVEDGFGLVSEMRDDVSHVDANYVRKLQEGDPCPPRNNAAGATFLFTFTSIGRYPLYDADFGFGKPIWATFFTQVPLDIVVLMPTRTGDGVEALVHLREDQLAKLEADNEFQAYASPRIVCEPLRSSI